MDAGSEVSFDVEPEERTFSLNGFNYAELFSNASNFVQKHDFIDVFQKNTHGFSREMNFDPYLGFVTLKS